MNRSLTTLMPPLTDTTLHIALLGPPKLIWDTQPVVLARRQVRALLYRLAVALQPVPRDHLCFLLWPDLPEAAARRNLTVLLTQLRHMLPFPEIVRTYDDAIALDPDYAQADTATFAAAVSHAPRAGQLDLLASSADLYRAPFLDGFALPASAEFDSWIAQERAVWERRYLDVLVALVDGYVALGDY
jgi:DNA-binding SARP family transcriptional activator